MALKSYKELCAVRLTKTPCFVCKKRPEKHLALLVKGPTGKQVICCKKHLHKK